MSIIAIRRALEKRLNAMTPAMATAWENDDFDTTVNSTYQRVNLLPAAPDDTIISARSYFQNGIFQVMLVYPTNTGPGVAAARANAVRLQFRRGSTLIEPGLSIHITKTPAIAPALIADGRYNVPVSITFQAQVFITPG